MFNTETYAERYRQYGRNLASHVAIKRNELNSMLAMHKDLIALRRLRKKELAFMHPFLKHLQDSVSLQADCMVQWQHGEYIYQYSADPTQLLYWAKRLHPTTKHTIGLVDQSKEFYTIKGDLNA
jgi:hypothetical protein